MRYLNNKAYSTDRASSDSGKHKIMTNIFDTIIEYLEIHLKREMVLPKKKTKQN